MNLSKLTKLPQVGKQMQAEVNRTLIILRKRTATRTGAENNACSVSAGCSLGYSKKEGFTFGVFSTQSMGAEFSAEASVGITLGLDIKSAKVETGVSRTMSIGASGGEGFSFGGDLVLDVDSKDLRLEFSGAHAKNQIGSGSAIRIGVGGNATVVGPHVRFNVTETKQIDIKSMILKTGNAIMNSKSVKSFSKAVNNFEKKLEDAMIDKIMGAYDL